MTVHTAKHSLLDSAAWVDAARNMATIWDRENTPASRRAADIADRFLRVAQVPPMMDPMSGGFSGAPAMGVTQPMGIPGMSNMSQAPTGANPMQAQTQQLWQAIQRVDQFYAAQLMELQKQIKGLMDDDSGAQQGQPAQPVKQGQPAQPTQPVHAGPADAPESTGDSDSAL